MSALLLHPFRFRTLATRTIASLSREQTLLNHVLTNAARSPESVLETIDNYCWETQRMMHVGDVKGSVIDDIIKLRKPKACLELGLYCGYSAVRISRLLEPDSHLVSIESRSNAIHVAEKIISHAGLSEKVSILHGTSSDMIPTLASTAGGPFDFIFLDHAKKLYMKDLLLLESNFCINEETVVVADNVKLAEASVLPYLEHVRKHYQSCYHSAYVSYGNELDGLEESTSFGGG